MWFSPMELQETLPNRGWNIDQIVAHLSRTSVIVLFLRDKKYLTSRIKMRKRRTVPGSGITAVSNAPQSFSFLNHRLAPSAVNLYSVMSRRNGFGFSLYATDR